MQFPTHAFEREMSSEGRLAVEIFDKTWPPGGCIAIINLVPITFVSGTAATRQVAGVNLL